MTDEYAVIYPEEIEPLLAWRDVLAKDEDLVPLLVRLEEIADGGA